MQDTVHSSAVKASDLDALLALNADYIRAVEVSDVERFDQLLGHDFVCSLPDGSHIDRNEFLQHIGAPATLSNLEAHDVKVRLLGDVALVHGRTTFILRDGAAGASRYTDVWARRDGRWVAVAAHVTRY